LAAVFALAAVPAFADPTVASKQAETQSVLGQIQQLDSSLERAVEAYNLANIKLAHFRREQGLRRRSCGDCRVRAGPSGGLLRDLSGMAPLPL
jgi:hypothetical protein